MKRDKERIRNLLIRLEERASGRLIAGGTLDMEVEERIDVYHLERMEEAGLVVQLSSGVWSLTNLGHDAVETIGKVSTWEKLKKASPSEAYEIVKGIGTSVAVVALSKVMGWG